MTYAGEHGPFDLVVLADGASSALRTARAATYPWGALWFVGTSDGFTGELYQVAERAHRLYGILPSGHQRMTRLLTPFFQSSSSFLGWLRDWTFPIANALPPLRNQMVRTMAGVSLGIAARPLALPAHASSRNSCPG